MYLSSFKKLFNIKVKKIENCIWKKAHINRYCCFKKNAHTNYKNTYKVIICMYVCESAFNSVSCSCADKSFLAFTAGEHIFNFLLGMFSSFHFFYVVFCIHAIWKL